MQEILGFYNNLYAILFLIIMLVTLTVKRDFYSYSGKLFKRLIILTIVLLLVEGIAFAADSVDTFACYYLNYWANIILFAVSPLICMFYGFYIDYKLFHSFERHKAKLFYSLPFAIGTIFVIINFFTPILFSLSSQNVYERGPLFYTFISMVFSYFLYFLVLVMKERKNIEKCIFWGSILLVSFPFVGGIIQALNYGNMSMYSMLGLGVLTAYISLESINTSKDYLTKLFTRVKAIDLIENFISKKKNFVIVMYDIDNFKEINDDYGHHIGDLVLIEFGNLLIKVFDDKSLISRFGGDEFLVVCKDYDEERINEIIQRLKDELINNIDFPIEFSYGCSFYDKTISVKKSDILVEVDHNMYANKSINKNYKRRESDK